MAWLDETGICQLKPEILICFYESEKMNSTKQLSLLLLVTAIASCLWTSACSASTFAGKPTPDEAIAMLKTGNSRFARGQSRHPHTGPARMAQAGSENQGDHAYATIIAC